MEVFTMKKIIALILSVMLLVPAFAMAEMTEAELHAWALANGYVKAESDAITSATSNKAGIVVFSEEATPVPITEAPVIITPKAIVTTPQPTDEPIVISPAPATAVPPVTEAPKADVTPAPTAEPDYAEGIHCTINGQSRCPIQGDTLLQCEAEVNTFEINVVYSGL